MSYSYTPRRAGCKRWLEAAPPFVLDCFDNGGKTADRYTVFFTGPLLVNEKPDQPRTPATTRIPYLGMSDSPTHPQGFSQWGELTASECADYRYRSGRQRVRWLDLPCAIREHVVLRAAPTHRGRPLPLITIDSILRPVFRRTPDIDAEGLLTETAVEFLDPDEFAAIRHWCLS